MVKMRENWKEGIAIICRKLLLRTGHVSTTDLSIGPGIPGLKIRISGPDVNGRASIQSNRLTVGYTHLI